MKKQTFDVEISTTGFLVLPIEASNEQEAIEIAQQMVWDGDVDTFADATDYETNCRIVK